MPLNQLWAKIVDKRIVHLVYIDEGITFEHSDNWHLIGTFRTFKVALQAGKIISQLSVMVAD